MNSILHSYLILLNIELLLLLQNSEFEKYVVSSTAKDAPLFKLHDRSLHVYSEARRVLASKRVCDEATAEASIVNYLFF